MYRILTLHLFISQILLSNAFHPSNRFFQNTHPSQLCSTQNLNTQLVLGSTKDSVLDTNVNPDEVTGKSITKEIMSFFSERSPPNVETDAILRNRLKSSEVVNKLDGMHMITLLFQSARAR